MFYHTNTPTNFTPYEYKFSGKRVDGLGWYSHFPTNFFASLAMEEKRRRKKKATEPKTKNYLAFAFFLSTLHIIYSHLEVVRFVAYICIWVCVVWRFIAPHNFHSIRRQGGRWQQWDDGVPNKFKWFLAESINITHCFREIFERDANEMPLQTNQRYDSICNFFFSFLRMAHTFSLEELFSVYVNMKYDNVSNIFVWW